MRPTIQEWAQKYAKAGDNPRGDFIRDLRGYSLFENTFEQTPEGFEHYISCRRGACLEAITLARRIFSDYRRWCRARGFDLA